STRVCAAAAQKRRSIGSGPKAWSRPKTRCRRLPALLRARRERPRRCRAAEKRDESAPLHLPPHSITSSARPSNVGCTVRKAPDKHFPAALGLSGGVGGAA